MLFRISILCSTWIFFCWSYKFSELLGLRLFGTRAGVRLLDQGGSMPYGARKPSVALLHYFG